MEKLIRRAIICSWIISASTLAIVASWWIIWSKNIPPQIPLFYSKPWGEEQLTRPIFLWIPTAMVAAAGLATNFISKKLKGQKVLATTIAAALAVGQLIIVLAIIRIILIVM